MMGRESETKTPKRERESLVSEKRSEKCEEFIFTFYTKLCPVSLRQERVLYSVVGLRLSRFFFASTAGSSKLRFV